LEQGHHKHESCTWRQKNVFMRLSEDKGEKEGT